MKNYFIFKYEDVVYTNEKKKVTVIFVHQETIGSQNTLSQEINKFFQKNSITDKLVVIYPKYLDEKSKTFFTDERESTFIRIPGKSKEYFDENLIIYSYDAKGKLSRKVGAKPENENIFIDNIFRNGNTIIFKQNGGIVESTSDHHFVFPSNKHCSKFLRTGNVLINQTEVFFLSIQLLNFFENIRFVYCDTSSINTLPYAVLELKRRFKIKFIAPTIFSFKSYELFESRKEKFPHDSLILISSSTSGNIIDRLLKEQRAEKTQIKVLFFLGKEKNYLDKKENIICNLTKDDNTFPQGEEIFDTSDSSTGCKLCEINSRPINIRGDVFLTIQPKVYKHLLTVKSECIPTNINSFVHHFRDKSKSINIIKTFYKDNDANANYEIYFDFINLIKNVEKFPSFKNSLDRMIDKYVPANTKYIIHLPDEGSLELSKYINNQINEAINPTIIELNKSFITKFNDEDRGAVLVVASCITTGKKLLQVSRLMRKFENLNLIYFTGIFRPSNESFANDLINDLKRGKDKSDEKPFIAVETLNTSIIQKKTDWAIETTFIETLLGNIDEDSELYGFFNTRIDILRKNKESRGLSNNLFLNKYDDNPLYLRKSFAFWKFNYEESEVNQSEVYFTISSIINNLENREINLHPSLRQTNYVRNLLSPRNFHRFNDGIIQSCLLRCSKPDYLSYDLDDEANLQMKVFLLSIISKYDSEDGEALLEFLLSIGLKKLKLKKEDLEEVLLRAKECDSKIISQFAEYISKFT
ncbi:hypothetical protein [uncultured Flavobacterium sp.]|uniref:hypothetical protein n=1 Tax=uncultured Flavobacterium sp. TaxID=165435 RepID=UPI0030821D6B